MRAPNSIQLLQKLRLTDAARFLFGQQFVQLFGQRGRGPGSLSRPVAMVCLSWFFITSAWLPGLASAFRRAMSPAFKMDTSLPSKARRASRHVFIQQTLQQRALQPGNAFAVGGVGQLVAQHQAYLGQQGEVGLERHAAHIRKR